MNEYLELDRSEARGRSLFMHYCQACVYNLWKTLPSSYYRSIALSILPV